MASESLIQACAGEPLNRGGCHRLAWERDATGRQQGGAKNLFDVYAAISQAHAGQGPVQIAELSSALVLSAFIASHQNA